jgi:hypothetical protein
MSAISSIRQILTVNRIRKILIVSRIRRISASSESDNDQPVSRIRQILTSLRSGKC